MELSKDSTLPHTPSLNAVYLFPIGLILLALSVVGCSTIQKLEERTYTRAPLDLKPLPTAVDVVVDSSNDHKLRKVNKSTPDILVEFPDSSWSALSSREKLYFQREILRRLPRSTARIHVANHSKSKSNPKDIDGILTVIAEPVEERNPTNDSISRVKLYRFQAVLKDPILDIVFYSTTLRWSHSLSLADSLVFWSEGNSVQTPSQHLDPPESVEFPYEEEWNRAMGDTVLGQLNIYSSSSDTVVRLNGEAMGEAPIRDRRVTNGIHRIEFSRPGYTPVIRSVQVRAGRSRTVIHEWEGDRTTSSIQIQSYPQGLELWMDSVRKGNTNYYESELLPGDKRIRLGKPYPGLNGRIDEYLYAEGVGVIPDRTTRTFALPYNMEEALSPENSEFWRPVGMTGFQPVFNPNLGFNKKTPVLVPGDYGYVSSFLFPMNMNWEGRFEEFSPDGSNFMIVLLGEDRCVALEAYGDEIALFEWKNETKKRFRSLGVWKFKKDTKPEEKIFQFTIDKNSEKPSLRIRLGNREIHKSIPPAGDFWRIGILTRGEKFRMGSGLKQMKIQYPDLIEWERKREKEKK